MQIGSMQFVFNWDKEKNDWLARERNLSFELVVEAAVNGVVIAEIDHPDPNRSNQRVIVIEVRGYMVRVPYVTDGKTKFLKTMFFDRSLQKKYGA